MNKVILIGRLTKDPDVRYAQGEDSASFARYTLAVDRNVSRDSGADQPTADFIPCIVFGKAVDFVEKYLQKGTKIAVEGRIQTGSYTNKDGQRVYTTDVVVERHEFCESKGNGSSAVQSQTTDTPQQADPAPTAAPAPQDAAPATTPAQDGFAPDSFFPPEFDPDALPFK